MSFRRAPIRARGSAGVAPRSDAPRARAVSHVVGHAARVRHHEHAVRGGQHRHSKPQPLHEGCPRRRRHLPRRGGGERGRVELRVLRPRHGRVLLPPAREHRVHLPREHPPRGHQPLPRARALRHRRPPDAVARRGVRPPRAQLQSLLPSLRGDDRRRTRPRVGQPIRAPGGRHRQRRHVRPRPDARGGGGD